MSAPHGIGLLIGHVMSTAMGNGKERNYNEKIRSADVEDFTKPFVTSSVMKNLPQDVDPRDIALNLSLNNNASNHERRGGERRGGDRRDYLELGDVVLKQLQKNLEAHGFTTMASSMTGENKAPKLILDVEIMDLSEGNRSNRFFRGDTGFVNLGMNFILTNPNKEGHPIIKHGKIVYVDPLKDRSFKERCSKGSGKAAILGVLPEIAQILNSQSKKAVRF